MSGFFVFKNFIQFNLTTSERKPLKCEISAKNSNIFNILAFFADYMWGGKKYLSNYNWIASRKIWYCALRHGQRKLCKQYVGQGAAGQELFRGRTQKVCQKRSVLAQKFKVRCGWCQKHRFLAHALKSVWNWSFFHYKREKCHCGTFLSNLKWK